MSVLDLGRLRERKAKLLSERQAAVSWGEQVLREFHAAATDLETPTLGNPDFLRRTFGTHAQRGVWPVLLEYRSDRDLIIEICFGAAVTRSGVTFVKGKQANAADTSQWIAVQCGFSIELMQRAVESALLGDPWTSLDAAKLAPSSR